MFVLCLNAIFVLSLCICLRAVRIYAAKRAYPTNTDIILVVVADVTDPVEFIWHFGDSTSAKTTSRTISKRYNKPGRYETEAKYAVCA